MSKIIFKNYHLSLYKTKRGFIYSQRRNINSTAILIYKKTKNDYQFLIRYQPLPELKIENFSCNWKTLFPCCVTGSLEKNETPTENAIKEVFEETNYKITKNNIKGLKLSIATTQSNESVYNFIADVSNIKKQNKKLGDGSIFEEISKNKWVNHKQLKQILFKKNNFYLSSLATCYLLFINNIYTKKDIK